MPRPSVLPLLIVLSSLMGAIQAPSVLHIRVMLVHADQKVTPVARHTLLISDNPATAPPREIVTTADGTADVRLPPGNYTIESDRPFVFEGKAYTWTQTLDVPPAAMRRWSSPGRTPKSLRPPRWPLLPRPLSRRTPLVPTSSPGGRTASSSSGRLRHMPPGSS